MLPGFDNRGRVYLEDGKILRQVNQDYSNQAHALFDLYVKPDLAAMVVVPTTNRSNLRWC